MQKLKLAFKMINSKTKIEKILLKIANDAKPDLSKEKQVIPIIQRFQESELSEDGKSLFEIFNGYLRNCRGWFPALKLLYISHELIDNVGSEFCRMFSAEYFDKISDLMSHKTDLEGHVHSVLAANYYNFLIIYAKYFSDIQMHLSRDPQELFKSLKKGDFHSLVQLISFKNVVKYFTKVEECIEGSESVLKGKDKELICNISILLFKDIAIIYNLISRNLQYAINYIFDLEDNLALLLDELYSDIVQVTNKLKQLISKSKLVDASQIPPIKYYEFDPQFNKKEELYILELKKSKSKNSTEKPDPARAYLEAYQTIAQGKKLYKFNTGVTHLMRIPDNPFQHQKEYFMLGSPEPSQLEEDSIIPLRDKGEQNGENYVTTQGAFILGETDVQSYKDINPIQLEIQFPKKNKDSDQYFMQNNYQKNMNKELNLNLNYDSPLTGKIAESVIFTPTSNLATHNFPEDNWPGNQIGNMKKELTKKPSIDNFNQDDRDKRRMNINFSNL